jgi:hypothetical protein
MHWADARLTRTGQVITATIYVRLVQMLRVGFTSRNLKLCRF